ncbi:Uncharacterised protein [Mycobacteroides abscessus subsp. abscessus]|nr:Uncharacterised protein [Mycobacteroides abscessus subsp. abscessus]
MTQPTGPVINLIANPRPRVANAAPLVTPVHTTIAAAAIFVLTAANAPALPNNVVAPVAPNKAPLNRSIGLAANNATPPKAVNKPIILPIIGCAFVIVFVHLKKALLILNTAAPTGAIPLTNPHNVPVIFLINDHTFGPFVSRYCTNCWNPSDFFNPSDHSANPLVTSCIPNNTL